MTKPLTIAQVLTTIRATGATAGRTEHGEYRVSLPGLTPERAEAIAAYCEDANEAIAAAEHATGKTAPRGWVIPCTLTGSIAYGADYPSEGMPVTFRATVENVTPDGSKMRARVTFPAQTINGQACPAQVVTRTVNMPAYMSESSDCIAARAAIEWAMSGAPHTATFND